MPDKDGRVTVCLDFDGVLNNYKGWKGKSVFEEPVPGAVGATHFLRDNKMCIIVCTTREEIGDVTSYLEKHDFAFDKVTNIKPVADIYIDDRAFRFDGDWSRAMDAIQFSKDVWWRQQSFSDEDLSSQHIALCAELETARQLHADKNRKYRGSFYKHHLNGAFYNLKRKWERIVVLMKAGSIESLEPESQEAHDLIEELRDLETYCAMTITKVQKGRSC